MPENATGCTDLHREKLFDGRVSWNNRTNGRGHVIYFSETSRTIIEQVVFSLNSTIRHAVHLTLVSNAGLTTRGIAIGSAVHSRFVRFRLTPPPSFPFIVGHFILWHLMAHRRFVDRRRRRRDGTGREKGEEEENEKKKTGKKKQKKKIAGNWELNPDVNHSCSRGQARSGH